MISIKILDKIKIELYKFVDKIYLNFVDKMLFEFIVYDEKYFFVMF